MVFLSVTMSQTALRRLMSEYKQLTENPPDGLIAGPVSDDNYFEWEAAITGEDTLHTES